MNDLFFVAFCIGGILVVSLLFVFWLEARNKFWEARKKEQETFEKLWREIDAHKKVGK